MPTVSFNTNFPGYDVLGEINRSNARVLKARHIATGDLVAIKHFTLNTDADTLRRFERESQIMSQMAHPNIVRVREVRLDADLPYLVMDYVEGGSLRQLLAQQGHLAVELTIRLGLQLLDVFRLIHAQRIVHRDIKPENILYHQLASGELHFLLTDFGVARLHEQPVTVTGQSMMTYEYASPEQFDNPRQVDAATDYYALGVVLYESLTGHVPFAMRDESGLVTFMNTVLTMPPPTPALPSGRALPASLTQLLDRLLAKRPADRLHNPDAVKLALKQAEVEQLHQEQQPPRSNVVGATTLLASPNPPAARTVATTGALKAGATTLPSERRAPDRRAPERRSPVRRSGRRWWPVAAALLGLTVAGLAAYYYVTHQTDGAPTEPNRPTTSSVAPPSVAQQAQREQRDREAARLRYEEEAADAFKRLRAQTRGGRVGLFGGVKGLSVELRNPSAVGFTSVAVRVSYLKDNGGLFKSTVMYFNNVKPGATIVRKAPDSPRGTTFSARVLRADPDRPDSVYAVQPPLP